MLRHGSFAAWFATTLAAIACSSSQHAGAVRDDAGRSSAADGSASPEGASPTRDAGADGQGAADATLPPTDAISGGDTSLPEGDSGVTDAGADTRAATTLPDAGGEPTGPWVIGYFSSWDSLTNGGFYPISGIDWGGLTHIAAAFYIPDGMGGWASGSFDDTTAMALITAAHQNGKKVIASIGGSNSGAGFEGSTGASYDHAFLASLQALVSMGYDGIDIDWEGGNLPVSQDQTLEQALLQAIRAQSPGIVVTMTAGTVNENSVGDLSFYGTVAPLVDRINLMSYGMAGAWQGWESWHSSPLHWNHASSTPAGIDTSAGHYLAAGVPAAKLGVGAGFYGECYTSPVTAPEQMLGASTIAASDGTMSYANILASFYSSNAYHYDSTADVPYLTLSGSNSQGCTYVTYEDPTSIAAKGAWIKAQGLGGLIIWTISEGYVASGTSVPAQNPMLEAIKTALLP